MRAHTIDTSSNSNYNVSSLQFTGNWYIDAGIFGFIKIMEEVYGWDLYKLDEMISKDPIKVYYGYFPFAYILKASKNSINKKSNVKEIILELERELERKTFSGDEEKYKKEIYNTILGFVVKVLGEFFNDQLTKDVKNYEDFIRKLNEEKEKTKTKIKNYLEKMENKSEDIKSLIEFCSSQKGINKAIKDIVKKIKSGKLKLEKEVDDSILYLYELLRLRLPLESTFYRNFLFYNPSYTLEKQVNSLFDVISSNISRQPILSFIDKTINKFLYSEQEFKNVSYTLLRSEQLAACIQYLFVYLICFEYAFIRYDDMGRMFFYSPDLSFCYRVNKKLEAMKELAEEKVDTNKIITITWEKVIDTLFEKKSSWSLENMYIISYRGMDAQKQSLIDVEYIGIPKLQASFLLDDKIRTALNKRIKYRKIENRFASKWVILEFIKGYSLYSLALAHIKLAINENMPLGPFETLLYSLILDAKLNEIRTRGEDVEKVIFSDRYFDNYKWIVEEVKREVRYTSLISPLIREVSKDEDKRREFARKLMTTLKDKDLFLYNLLRELNINKTLCTNEEMNRFIFNKLILNNINWRNYGLILILDLVR